METNQIESLKPLKRTDWKFSEAICDLADTWILWCKNDLIARDESLTYGVRKVAAENCEMLIKQEYHLQDIMNDFFDKKRN